MQNYLGGGRLPEPLIFKLTHPIRHQCRNYREFRFYRRANIADVAAGQAITDDDRKIATVVLARLAGVPKGVMDKLHDTDLMDLINGTGPLFELVHHVDA